LSTLNGEILPNGYAETLKDCTALGANLLSLAVTGESVKRCWDCSEWVGRCKRDHVFRIARDEACIDFSSKKVKVNINAGNNETTN
jgi:predicted metal-binding protein